jgi:hypothetical protein
MSGHAQAIQMREALAKAAQKLASNRFLNEDPDFSIWFLSWQITAFVTIQRSQYVGRHTIECCLAKCAYHPIVHNNVRHHWPSPNAQGEQTKLLSARLNVLSYRSLP